MEVPVEIIQLAHETKKRVYEDVYDVNNEKYYEGELKETESRYLATLEQIHQKLKNILMNGSPNSVKDIGNVSNKTKESFHKLIITIQSARSDDPSDNIPIESFLDNYFFRYAWWLGNSEE
ncbi:MAG: hypothetical protein EBT86_00120 [Actinobacteria bacterium]|nr:hypothetical protein [Actinomycetota bacterium]NDG28242.1 hypothetical protein [Pseudomonadota bacterium]